MSVVTHEECCADEKRTPADVADDFAYAREVMQRPVPRRHSEAEAQIAAAHAPPNDMEIAMQEVDRVIEDSAQLAAEWATRNQVKIEPSIVLTGADMTAFDEFALAAAALEAHAKKQQELQVDYRNALETVSRMAARRNRGG